MNNTCSLQEKKCTPCQGNVPPLNTRATQALLEQLNDHWSINAAGHLVIKYPFADFITALDFANAIALVAEQEGHHPDLTISWGACGIELWTHKIQGLTESDFILASKIEQISR
jgi:4a-hydroxytetrahydrobiopterin dehydratase